jgi:glyoxylate carboligase
MPTMGKSTKPLSPSIHAILSGCDCLKLQSRGLEVPVVTTYKAKGVIPEDHPLSIGGAGLSPRADHILQPLFTEADLVICAGYDPIEMRAGWRNLWDPADQRVIEFAAEPNRHYMHHAMISFVCDVGEGLKSLAKGATPGSLSMRSYSRVRIAPALRTFGNLPKSRRSTLRKAHVGRLPECAGAGSHRVRRRGGRYNFPGAWAGTRDGPGATCRREY